MAEPRTLLPPDHPDAPRYWMHETSGMLAPVVEAYLKGLRLAPNQIKIMRAYLWQWVNSPVWGSSGALESLRLRVAAIKTRQDIHAAIESALDLGMDPL